MARTVHPARTPRGLAAVATLALGLSLATAVPPASQAAAPGCLTERQDLPLLDPGCDDTTPPDTEITGRSFVPNSAGWIATDTVTFQFREVVEDGDTGPWGFRCRVVGPVTTDLEPCTSPVTYDDLPDTQVGSGQGPWRFEVYAVDEGDAPISWRGSLLQPGRETTPDDDSASPAIATWRADTRAPETRIGGLDPDPVTPGSPVQATLRPVVFIGADEGTRSTPVTWTCALDGAGRECAGGPLRLGRLAAGDHEVTATATDVAGNTDPTPQRRSFHVPRELAASGGWTTRASKGALGGDVLVTRTRGTVLSTRLTGVRDLRVVVPTGPGLGVVEWRLGRGRWAVVPQGAERTRQAQVVVLAAYDRPTSGRLQLRARTSGRERPAVVDGLVAR